MKELYEKVAADSTLQTKFFDIVKNAEQKGEEATSEKLIDFAKEAGYNITLDEIKAFFKELAVSTQSGCQKQNWTWLQGANLIMA